MLVCIVLVLGAVCSFAAPLAHSCVVLHAHVSLCAQLRRALRSCLVPYARVWQRGLVPAAPWLTVDCCAHGGARVHRAARSYVACCHGLVPVSARSCFDTGSCVSLHLHAWHCTFLCVAAAYGSLRALLPVPACSNVVSITWRHARESCRVLPPCAWNCGLLCGAVHSCVNMDSCSYVLLRTIP